MKISNLNLYVFLVALNSIGLIISNVTAGTIVTVFGLQVSIGLFMYPVTFLATDIIGEIFGEKQARTSLYIALILSILGSLFFFMSTFLPYSPEFTAQHEAYISIIGLNLRFTIASLLTYIISQNIDVTIFHYLGMKTRGEKKWLRNNLSTFCSQAVDTFLFYFLALYGVLDNIWVLATNEYMIKIVLALLDTFVFYAFTFHKKSVFEDQKNIKEN